jgi:hypothetical protein
MANEIKEGVAAEPEVQAVEAQPAEGEAQAPEVQEGVEAEVEPQPAVEATEEVAAVDGAEPAPVEAPKPEAPVITKEIADDVANWKVWKAILDRNPELRERAKAEYQKMVAPQQQAPAQPQVVDEVALEREYNQLVEQGKHYEATRLLVRYDPEVQRTRSTVEEFAAKEHSTRMENAAREISSHIATFGQIEPAVKAEMSAMLSAGYGGDLMSARVAVLTKMGRIRDAQALLTKAATAPLRQGSSSAGGRTPASRGSPAPMRVAKPGPTPGSGMTPDDVSYIEKRERERGGGL